MSPRTPEQKRAQDRARRARKTLDETPTAFARRVGLDVQGGSFVTWESLLPLAVRSYWKRRPCPARAKDVA